MKTSTVLLIIYMITFIIQIYKIDASEYCSKNKLKEIIQWKEPQAKKHKKFKQHLYLNIVAYLNLDDAAFSAYIQSILQLYPAIAREFCQLPLDVPIPCQLPLDVPIPNKYDLNVQNYILCLEPFFHDNFSALNYPFLWNIFQTHTHSGVLTYDSDATRKALYYKRHAWDYDRDPKETYIYARLVDPILNARIHYAKRSWNWKEKAKWWLNKKYKYHKIEPGFSNYIPQFIMLTFPNTKKPFVLNIFDSKLEIISLSNNNHAGFFCHINDHVLLVQYFVDDNMDTPKDLKIKNITVTEVLFDDRYLIDRDGHCCRNQKFGNPVECGTSNFFKFKPQCFIGQIHNKHFNFSNGGLLQIWYGDYYNYGFGHETTIEKTKDAFLKIENIYIKTF